MSLLNKASLIQIPSGYKDGTLYSAKPINGDGDFTFSRGSNLAATRVNSEGLIEKGRENLLLQSNQFDTTWTTTRLSGLTSGQSGYDGSSDAWSVIPNTANDDHKIYQSISQTGVVTFSVYAKANGYNGLALVSSNTNNGKFFNLSNGTLGNDFNSSPIDSTITEVSNGWYRCEVVFNVSAGNFFTIYVSSDGISTHSFSGNGTNGIYIQDAQLEQGLVSTDVITTTTTTAQAGILEDMPRLDYSGGASCPSLLLEPQRANKIPNSEYLNAVTKSNVTINTNSDISPEGVQNAHNVIANATNSDHLFFQSSMGGSTNANTQTIYAKANGYDWIHIRFDIPTKRAFFNIANGTLGTADSGITHTIEDVGNGWYRCSATMTTTNYANAVLALASADNTTNFLGDGTSGVLMYGWQSEEASYATSYIPTYGASSTRSQDSCSKTGISSLIGQTEGTLFFDANFDDSDTVNFSISDGTSSNYVLIDTTSARSVFARVQQGGVTQVQINTTSSFYSVGERLKCAIAYKSNDFAFYINGTSIGTDNSGSVPALDQLRFSRWNGALAATQRINQAILFPTRLTNDELASLTTL
jgi:hypothetical protein